MKRVLAAAALSAGLVLASAGVASAGMSDTAQVHPGHQGYLMSGGTGGGIPTAHFAAHGGPGYPSGPGGWGEAVSTTAKEFKGIANAHR